MDGRSDLAGVVLGGRYELQEPIGAGGMAVVWRARDHVLARTVAVKIVAADQGEPRHIRREAQAAAGLSHPNIAQVHDYGEMTADERIFPYVVMELVEGGTLADRMVDGPLRPRQAMRICAEIAAALAAAHAVGLVHRDIKPANVMLGPTGAKVVDFGIAAATAPSGAGGLAPEVLGTPAYLAPERLIDDAVEPASDVYALGVVLYRLLSGHSPWTSEDTTQMLTAHIYLEPAPLPPVTGVPAFIAELCERCLIKDPSRRPSAREASILLSRAAGAWTPDRSAGTGSLGGTTRVGALGRAAGTTAGTAPEPELPGLGPGLPELGTEPELPGLGPGLPELGPGPQARARPPGPGHSTARPGAESRATAQGVEPRATPQEAEPRATPQGAGRPATPPAARRRTAPREPIHRTRPARTGQPAGPPIPGR